MDLATIKIGFGLGDVPFGLTRVEVRRLLGEPSRILDDSQDPGSELWLYDGHSIALGFEREWSYRLAAFEISTQAAVLEGHRLIGLHMEAAALALKEVFAFPIEAVLSDEETTEQLRLPDLALSIWIEAEFVESISWSVLVGSRGEVLWPDSPVKR
jgi:hypothetical protein